MIINIIKRQKKTLGKSIATNMTTLKILSLSKSHAKSKRKTVRPSQKDHLKNNTLQNGKYKWIIKGGNAQFINNQSNVN